MQLLQRELYRCQTSLDAEAGAVGGAHSTDAGGLNQAEAERMIIDLLRVKNYTVALESASSLK